MINAIFLIVHKECGYVSECRHWIEVHYLEQRIKVQSDLQVEVNGHAFTSAQLWRLSKKTNMKLAASKVGEQVIIRSIRDRFKVIYDTRGQLEIEVNMNFIFHIYLKVICFSFQILFYR